MSKKHIILLISLVVIIEANSRVKKQVCDQSMDFTPVPGDCSKFYRCANGQLVVMDCNSGLYFDNNLKVCNWPDQVSCNSDGAAESCSSDLDLTQVPQDCSKYYRCTNGVLSINSCQNGLYFDNNLKVCNWPSQVICSYSDSATCDPASDLTPTPNDCSKFYRCINGLLTVLSCPNGYFFDKNAKACNPSSQVTSCNTNTCSSIVDLTPVPGNCSQFYRCVNNVQTILTCPSGYLFDRLTKNCNLASQVNCNSCDPNLDLTPFPNDCSKFYRCVNGELSVITCPSGYLFDRNEKTCKSSNQVNCAVCDPSIDLTQVPNDCSRFYRCVNGVLSTLTCPSGYLFDRNAKACNPSSQVNCNICDPSTDLTQVPNDCARFYRCVNGEQTILTCPSGYLFDKNSKSCNPENQVTTCYTCGSQHLTNVPGDCSRYYVCSNNDLSIYNCPAGYSFDNLVQKCRITSEINGKCGTNPFPNCPFSLSSSSRLELCAQSGFKTDYPTCC